ncbi:MAG: putative sulfate exporter family transporter [Muribaculaceae bacterium]|nr:putative sulfate exporter family transporter [Muribaculaceae bacterium]
MATIKYIMNKIIYIAIIFVILIPFNLLGLNFNISPALALLIGLLYAMVFNNPFPKFNKKASKYLLQASVVGLGFGMNIIESLKSGYDGMIFTIVSVFGVMILGVTIGYLLHINRKTSYLIASGTAICGGSAIAAVGPVIKANENEMAISLGVIFILNAIALFIFPPIGHYFNLTETQFGTWAAIAIHDTSSVVGAGEAFGATALQTATLIKLTRALWIIPLALITMMFFRDKSRKISIPWFIFLFIIAMIINTYCYLPQEISKSIIWLAKRGLVITLFMIGASLSISSIKNVGFKPLLLAIALWIIIGISSFFVVNAYIK